MKELKQVQMKPSDTSTWYHSSITHPYGRWSLWMTPIRVVWSLTSSLIWWFGLLPLCGILAALRMIYHTILRLMDECLKSQTDLCGHPHTRSTRRDSTLTNHSPFSSAASAPNGHQRRNGHTNFRLIQVTPEDRMWMEQPTATASNNAATSPGGSAHQLIHAVLAFERPVSIDLLRATFNARLLSRSTFARFKWYSIKRIIQRWWLPNVLGGRVEEFFWLEDSDEEAFDLTQHIRVVPNNVWRKFPLSKSDSRGVHMKVKRPTPLLSSEQDDTEIGPAANDPPPSHHPPLDPVASLRMAHLQAYLSHLSSTPLMPYQPLWEMLLLEPTTASGSSRRDEYYVIFRCSHAIADGVLLSGIILKTFLEEESNLPPIPRSLPSSNLSQLNPTELNTIRVHLSSAPDDQSTHSPAAPCASSPTLSTASSPSTETESETLPLVPSSALPSHPPPSRPSRPSSSCGHRFTSIIHTVYMWLLFFFTGPYLILHKSFQPDDENILHGTAPAAASTPRKEICWSVDPVSLVDVKRVSKKLNVTLNDLVMNIWLEVMDEYLINSEEFLSSKLKQKRGSSSSPQLSSTARAPSSMFIIVPFNVRTAKELDFNSSNSRLELGNKFAVLLVDLPMGQALRSNSSNDRTTTIQPSFTPFIRRLRYLSGYMHHLKTGSLEPFLMYSGISFLVRYLPAAWSKYLLDSYSNLCSMVITNNRSAEAPLYLIDTRKPSEATDLAAASTHSTSLLNDPGHLSTAFDSASSSSSPTVSLSSPSLPSLPLQLHPPNRLNYWVSWAPQRNTVGICVTIITYHGQLRVSIVADESCLRFTTPNQLIQQYQLKLNQLVHETDCAPSELSSGSSLFGKSPTRK